MFVNPNYPLCITRQDTVFVIYPSLEAVGLRGLQEIAANTAEICGKAKTVFSINPCTQVQGKVSRKKNG